MAELEKLPVSEARWEWREQPETYAEAWRKADTEARRQLFLKRKVTATVAVRGRVARHSRGTLEVHLYTMDVDPAWMAEQEARAAEERKRHGVPEP